MPVADLTFLNSFAGGDREKVNKYINLFLQHAPAMVSSMEKHLGDADYPSLKTTAHALKPQITYMGIKGGEELIKRIENNAGEQKNTESLPGQLDELKKLLDQAYPELKSAITG